MVPPVVLASILTWNETENRLVSIGLGGVLFALGLLLRFWCQLHLHYRLKVSTTLTTTGPYAYVRNPIYIGNTIMLVGAVILGELLWLAPLMVVYCAIVYNIVVRYEESHLIDKYGQLYVEYLESTPRWIPNFHQARKHVIVSTSKFIIPSLFAEAPLFSLLLPFITKELMFIH